MGTEKVSWKSATRKQLAVVVMGVAAGLIIFATLVAELAGVEFRGALSILNKNGIWILVDDREHYLPFEQFPWFREATVSQLSDIVCPRPGHLRWPQLDVDLTLDSIVDPKAYPLVSG